MIVVLMVDNEQRNVMQSSASGKHGITECVRGVLVFEDEQQFDAWVRSGEHASLYPNCGFWILPHAKDMRTMDAPIVEFRPKCRHCKWYEPFRELCRNPRSDRFNVADYDTACEEFKER